MIKVLFVCMGNICRSPTAEGVFRHLLRENNLEDLVDVDSAGTHGYHVGEAPDQRTQRAAARRGYDLSGIRARKVAPQDLEYFDLILAMDRNSLETLLIVCPPDRADRLGLFMDYSKNFDDDEVPDPYMDWVTDSIWYLIWSKMRRMVWSKLSKSAPPRR